MNEEDIIALVFLEKTIKYSLLHNYIVRGEINGIIQYYFYLVYYYVFASSLAFSAGFVFIIIYAVKQKSKNDNAPRLTVEAKVVDKRTVSHRHHNHNNHFSHRHYYHYVSFEFQDGQRTELRVSKSEFDSLAVADVGMLTLQGTRFIAFVKNCEVAH